MRAARMRVEVCLELDMSRAHVYTRTLMSLYFFSCNIVLGTEGRVEGRRKARLFARGVKGLESVWSDGVWW